MAEASLLKTNGYGKMLNSYGNSENGARADAVSVERGCEVFWHYGSSKLDPESPVTQFLKYFGPALRGACHLGQNSSMDYRSQSVTRLRAPRMRDEWRH